MSGCMRIVIERQIHQCYLSASNSIIATLRPRRQHAKAVSRKLSTTATVSALVSRPGQNARHCKIQMPSRDAVRTLRDGLRNSRGKGRWCSWTSEVHVSAGNFDVIHQILGPHSRCGKNFQWTVHVAGRSGIRTCGQQVRLMNTSSSSSNEKVGRALKQVQETLTDLLTRFKAGFKKQPSNTVISIDVENLLKSSSSQGESKPNESDRLKIAFAEGYLSGSKNSLTSQTPRWMKILQPVLTALIVIGLCLAFLASTNGSMFRMQMGKQVEIDPVEIHVTFEDVKGVDEAKQELKEVVEFLKNPQKFSALGGKLPKGVLLVGPPGTGKTLLARAVAGEARVPFFHAAGPEFDEILVGQGARRVRDLFKAAKETAPCVIFIDEIDSVGSKRTNSVLHPYANQTINQLLSEMDGFHQNEGVIVLGATNRREDLDKALMRPGRFDVEVMVPTPDYQGRRQIFELYLGKILCREVDVDILARGTVGFTGADIENMVNQAALKAAVDGAECVTMAYLENARDKVLMGPERKTRIPDEEANLITAYHEGGHTIVGFYTKDAHPLHKVTIMPRGPSLGHTAYIPEKERYHVTKSQLLALMDTMMGGRAAEELIFGPEKITSGASNDLKQATMIATHMVKDWGMSEKIGLRTLDEGEKSYVTVNELGQTLNEAIDAEIKRILQESYERAKSILKAHAREHKLLAEALVKYETLDADDIKAILQGKNNDEGTDMPINLDQW